MIFFSIFFKEHCYIKHFSPLYPDQPLVEQENRAFKIPEYWSGLPG